MIFAGSWAQVLNLLLHKLTDRQADAAELAFLAVDEQLVDIGDDLFDYEVIRRLHRDAMQEPARE